MAKLGESESERWERSSRRSRERVLWILLSVVGDAPHRVHSLLLELCTVGYLSRFLFLQDWGILLLVGGGSIHGWGKARNHRIDAAYRGTNANETGG